MLLTKHHNHQAGQWSDLGFHAANQLKKIFPLYHSNLKYSARTSISALPYKEGSSSVPARLRMTSWSVTSASWDLHWIFIHRLSNKGNLTFFWNLAKSAASAIPRYLNSLLTSNSVVVLSSLQQSQCFASGNLGHCRVYITLLKDEVKVAIIVYHQEGEDFLLHRSLPVTLKSHYLLGLHWQLKTEVLLFDLRTDVTACSSPPVMFGLLDCQCASWKGYLYGLQGGCITATVLVVLVEVFQQVTQHLF